MTVDPLVGKRVILGVSGSIAAYKAVALASELVKAGVVIDIVMTPAATKFVSPLSFAAIVHRPVLTDLFTETAAVIPHVSIGVGADAFIVAPATADCIAGLALGLGDDAVRATALSSKARLFIAPAMESLMLEHPATQANLDTLRRRGAHIIESADGHLASGRSGRGRLAEPADIVNILRESFSRKLDLERRRIVVTAGGTREPIDPVRFIGNHSSGKMGFAIAAAARDRGAEVTLIAGSTSVDPPTGVRIVHITTAMELQEAIQLAVVGVDAIIMAAAVADYRVASVSEHKLKRSGEDVMLRLVPNPDIIAGIKGEHLVKVGFAAETDDLIANARVKLERKGLDLIVANDVSAPGSGFNADTNQVAFIDSVGTETLPLMLKSDVADRVLDRIAELIRRRN